MEGSSWTLDEASGSTPAAAAAAAAATEDEGDVRSYLSYDLVSVERIDARRRLSYNSRACSRLPSK